MQIYIPKQFDYVIGSLRKNLYDCKLWVNNSRNVNIDCLIFDFFVFQSDFFYFLFHLVDVLSVMDYRNVSHDNLFSVPVIFCSELQCNRVWFLSSALVLLVFTIFILNPMGKHSIIFTETCRNWYYPVCTVSGWYDDDTTQGRTSNHLVGIINLDLMHRFFCADHRKSLGQGLVLQKYLFFFLSF